jgi:hypothetical protein
MCAGAALFLVLQVARMALGRADLGRGREGD